MENQPLHPNRLGSTKVSGAVESSVGTDASAARQAEALDNPLASIPPVPVGGYGPDSRHTPLRAAGSKTTALAQRHAPNLQPCPHCGAMQPTSTSVCMACGTFFPAHKSSNIRCRHCGTHASANLTLCPNCGRRLQAAPSFAMRWIAPVLLVLLFLLLIRQWSGMQTLQWTQAQAAAGWTWLNELGERLDPQITIATIPDTDAPDPLAPDALADGSIGEGSIINPSESAQTTLGELLETGVNAIAVVPTASDSRLSSGNDSEANGTANVTATVVEVLAFFTTTTAPTASPAAVASIGGETVSSTATPSPTAPPTPTPVPPTPSATPVPTRVATETATASPTAPSPTAPSPTATGSEQATPSRQLTQAAAQQQIAASALDGNRQATAVGSRGAASILQPTSTFAPDLKTPDAGEQVATRVPTATVTPAPSSTPTDEPTATTVPTAIPTATPAAATTYVIKSGDTPSTIAARYGVGVNALLAANGLGLEDARRLRVGQELIIPNGNQPSPTATVPPTATPPTVAATALSPTPSAAQVLPTPADSSGIRLDTPQLRSPESGSFLSCGEENSLIWLPVPFIREDDMYLLHLGFLTGYNTDGTETVIWVLEQQQPANVTIWRMDEGLCSLAPQTFGRQWRWYVEVIETAENGLQPVSLPSAIWAFSWN